MIRFNKLIISSTFVFLLLILYLSYNHNSVKIKEISSFKKTYTSYVKYNKKKKRLCISKKEIKFKYNTILGKQDYICFKKDIENGIYEIKFRNQTGLLVVSTDISKLTNTLVITPDFTWSAYNITGGKNLYFKGVNSVSLTRPLQISEAQHPYWNPLGIIKKDLPKLKASLLSQEIIEKNFSRINNKKFKLIILYGHNEYWTKKFENFIKNQLDKGANLLNMSGNTNYRNITLFDNQIFSLYSNIGGVVRRRNLKENIESILGISFYEGGYSIHKEVEAGTKTYDDILDILKKKQIVKNSFTVENLKKIMQGARIRNFNHPIFNNIKTNDLYMNEWIGIKKNHIMSSGYNALTAVETDGTKININNQTISVLAESLLYKKLSRTEKANYIMSGTITEKKYKKSIIINLPFVCFIENVFNDEIVKKIMINSIQYALNNYENR